MKTRLSQAINDQHIERHAFGVTDKAGRAVGANIQRSVQTYEQISEESRGWLTILPGTYFSFMGVATRGGQPCGASQSWNRFATEEERAAAEAKYLKAAKARALKQFAKVAA